MTLKIEITNSDDHHFSYPFNKNVESVLDENGDIIGFEIDTTFEGSANEGSGNEESDSQGSGEGSGNNGYVTNYPQGGDLNNYNYQTTTTQPPPPPPTKTTSTTIGSTTSTTTSRTTTSTTTTTDDEPEIEYEEEKICNYQDITRNSDLYYAKAQEKFDLQLRLAARESGGSFSPKFGMKIRHRYETLIKLRNSKFFSFFTNKIFFLSCQKRRAKIY